MSSHKVLVTTIASVAPHPNADRLDIVQVFGWSCVTQRGAFRPGDKCVYIPIDSVLSPTVEAKLFPPDAKVKLHHSRVKTIKLRGCVSQGMAVSPDVIGLPINIKDGTDVAYDLGITKYEPPAKPCPNSGPKKARKWHSNPHFAKYTDLENIKNYPAVFEQGETVQVTEKIHGTNFRAGWVPFVERTWWHKVKGWFGANPEWEFVYGSRNLQLQDRPKDKTYYETNVYAEAVEKYGLRDKLHPGQVAYGEIYGPDIQKGYHYGLKAGERKLVLFDLKVFPIGGGEAVWVDPVRTRSWFITLKLPIVPLLYDGPYQEQTIKDCAKGASKLAPSQAVREGCVVRPMKERTSYCGRVILKVINDDYLLSKHADEEVAHDQVA